MSHRWSWGVNTSVFSTQEIKATFFREFPIWVKMTFWINVNAHKLELVLKWPNLVPDRIGALKRGNITDTIRRFLVNFAILAFSLPENDLRQPLYLVVSKSMNNFSLGRSSISKKRILGTDPKLALSNWLS